MNEAETRAEHIDPALKAAGWGVVEGSRVLREHGITLGRLQGGGKRAKAEIADYVLVYLNTKLAVIEAKAWDKPHTEGVGQAKSYAAKLAVRFTYATNGQAIYGIDMATGAEGRRLGRSRWQRSAARVPNHRGAAPRWRCACQARDCRLRAGLSQHQTGGD